METYTKTEINGILKKHALYLKCKSGGERADLRYANLRYTDLCNANLSYANLSYANLRYADLINADLSDADLSYANLSNAELRNANLINADLRNADLSYADLSNAELRNAELRYADLRNADLSYADLSYVASGNNREIKTLQLGKYYTVVSELSISVDCQTHTLKQWQDKTDREVLKMDGRDGLAWWKKWKNVIFQVAESMDSKINK